MKDMLKLLQRLEEDCTLSNAQLAALVNCSEDEVAAVRRELEEQRIILGYKAIVDWDRTQREAVTALIEVKVTPQRGRASTASPSASISMTRWKASTLCPAPLT